MLIRQLRHVYQKGNITGVSFALAIDTKCIVFAESYLYIYIFINILTLRICCIKGIQKEAFRPQKSKYDS